MKAEIKIVELGLFDDQQYAIVNINGNEYTFDIDVDWKVEFIEDWTSTDRGDLDASTFEITASRLSWTQFQVGQLDDEDVYFDMEIAKQIAELIITDIENTNEAGESILMHEGHIDRW